MRSVLLIGLIGGCASAAANATLRDRYDAALAAGEWPEAYVLAGDVLCEEPTLAAGREMVQLWDRLGRPSEPVLRIEDCDAPAWVESYVRAMTQATRGDTSLALREFAAAVTELKADRNRRPELAEVEYRRWPLPVAIRGKARGLDGIRPRRAPVAGCDTSLALREFAAAVTELKADR
ncbi:MAG: hypothetical protein AAFX94_07750, partial [Myxococcota bacterium]